MSLAYLFLYPITNLLEQFTFTCILYLTSEWKLGLNMPVPFSLTMAMIIVSSDVSGPQDTLKPRSARIPHHALFLA